MRQYEQLSPKCNDRIHPRCPPRRNQARKHTDAQHHSGHQRQRGRIPGLEPIRQAGESPAECERTREPSVSQVLNLLNSTEIQAKLTHEAGTVAKLVRAQPDDAKLVEELYLTFFARRPSTDETAVGVKHLKRYANNRRTAAEDLAWAMLNSMEFLFNH